MNAKNKKFVVVIAIILAALMVGSMATLTISLIISSLSTKAEDAEGALPYTPEEDLYEGTLKMEASADGTTVTISYDVNGETVSYTVPNNYNYTMGGYAATDDLDRTMYTSAATGAYGSTGEHYIGLFYFLWQGEHGDSGIFDLQKIIDEVGVEAAGNTSCGKYGPVGAMHWFAEPLYGYYYANDQWVHRKHAELLTQANVDFLYFDVTNGYAYLHNATKLMECLHELNEQGFDAPQVVFYTNSASDRVIRECYDTIYKVGLYEDTWFKINGKPVIIGPMEHNILTDPNDPDSGFFTMMEQKTFQETGFPLVSTKTFKGVNDIPFQPALFI